MQRRKSSELKLRATEGMPRGAHGNAIRQRPSKWGLAGGSMVLIDPITKIRPV
jgi:hypothetical protein